MYQVTNPSSATPRPVLHTLLVSVCKTSCWFSMMKICYVNDDIIYFLKINVNSTVKLKVCNYNIVKRIERGKNLGQRTGHVFISYLCSE